MKNSIAIRKPVGTSVANDNSGTTITSAAWVELSAALGAPASAIEVYNTSSKAIKLATGGAGSEVEVPYIIPPSASSTIVPLELKKGVRLAAKALGADATTGFLVINFLA